MSSVHPTITVALSDECMDSLFALPRGQQNKVNEFIKKFRKNPTGPGINYEVIKGARDPNLRSVRIDQAYRGIVLAPRQGNVYIMLWVDHHDEAYAWATRRRYTVNQTTGALQVFHDPEPGEEPVLPYQAEAPLKPPPAPVEDAALQPVPPPFATIRHDDLLALGVPAELIPLVRHLPSSDALDAARSVLPDDAYESLSFLVAGFPLHEVLSERQRPPAPIDPEDFAAALAHPDSRRHFVVVDDEALAAILDAPLERWRTFLHPSQRQLVEADARGPIRVLGGAGTGKTVVAMHRAVHLATRILQAPSDRVLVTTYTKNLAADLASHLQALAPAEILKKLEVVNLDAWVFEKLKALGMAARPAFGAEADQIWRRATDRVPDGMSAAFLDEEFSKVVLAQGIDAEEAYLAASRTGRGTVLSRRQRREAWQVFAAYRAALAEKGLMRPEDAMRRIRLALAEAQERPYQAVVVDESQDLGTQAFLLIRQLVAPGPNDIFLVGDAHQRIYGHRVVLSKCGIEVRGRSHRLRINYRTTDEIRAWAVQLMAGQAIDDLDGGQDSSKGYKSLMHGQAPEVRVFPDAAQELEFVAARVAAWRDQGVALQSICVVARTNAIRDALAGGLRQRGLETFVIDRDGDAPAAPGVRVATMHRVKGLEFERVAIAQVNADVVPLALALGGGSDAVSVDERMQAERALLYVAVTRAKREALITAGGLPSPFLAASSRIASAAVPQRV